MPSSSKKKSSSKNQTTRTPPTQNSPSSPSSIPRLNLTSPSPVKSKIAMPSSSTTNTNRNLLSSSSVSSSAVTTTTSSSSSSSSFEKILLRLRWPVVILSVLIVFLSRDYLTGFTLGVLDALSWIKSSVVSTFTSSSNNIKYDSSSRLPLGCQTESVGDALALLTILFHHEFTLFLCLITALSVDSFGSWLLSKRAASSSSSSSSQTLTKTKTSSLLVFTPRSVSSNVVTLLPEGAQSRIIFAVMLLLLLGVDIGEANIRFMSLSVSKEVLPSFSSSASRKERVVSNSKKKMMSSEIDTFFVSSNSLAPPIIARNKHLECELRHAISSSGLVFVSGSRGLGKSTSTRLQVANRSGFYCDVHRAASADTLEATVEKCIDQHNLLNNVPNAWQSLSLAVRHFFSHWLWKIASFDNLASAFFVASYWQVSSIKIASNAVEEYQANFYKSSSSSNSYDAVKNDENMEDGGGFFSRWWPLSSSSSMMSISDPNYLAKRCVLPKKKTTLLDHDNENSNAKKPLVFVLDGVRDSSSGVLGLLDAAPNVLGLMQNIANVATIVIVAASDDTLNDIQELPHLQFISGMSSRVAFVTASPAEVEDVTELYSSFGKESLKNWCNKEVTCAKMLFGGAFEYIRSWANMLSPRPNVDDEEEFAGYCNDALRTVVSSAFSTTESVAGWQLGSSHYVASVAQGGGGGGAPRQKTSSSSRSVSTKDALSFRLRSLHFMLIVASKSASSFSSSNNINRNNSAAAATSKNTNNNNKDELSISDCDQDIVEKFLKAQLVYEETIQFPLCQKEDHQHNSNNNKRKQKGTTTIKAVAPTLFNVSLAQILVKKRMFIDEAIEILQEECDNKNTKNNDNNKNQIDKREEGCKKWVNAFVRDLQTRIRQHRDDWWLKVGVGGGGNDHHPDESLMTMNETCGNALEP